MDEDNVELVRRLCRMISEGDLDYVGLYDPDIEFREASELPDAGVQRGIPAMVQARARFEESFERIVYEPLEFRGAGDRVLVSVRYRGRARHTGIEGEAIAYWVFTVRNRKVTQCHIFTQRSQAFAAAGLRDR
jgi:ketosteroid isomerase-like protein